jgi:3-hydroxyacyl-[acyl-carrier-protein] dehydratase
MLQNTFFTFSDLQVEGDLVKTDINLNAAHPIFKGHFPEQAVVPGVCMLQMVKEILEAYIKQETRLSKAGDLKFLSFIYPDENKLIQVELKITMEDEWIIADARLLDNAAILFKFKGIFVRR